MRGFLIGGGLLLLVLASACGHVSSVRPVPKGSFQPEIQGGGPIADVTSSLTLPLPATTIGGRYGLSDRFDVSAHAHATSLIFRVAGVDVGSTYLALEQEGWRPALSVGGRLYGFLSWKSWEPWVALEAYGSASWKVRELLMPYVSASALVQFAGAPPLASIGAGTELMLGDFGLQLEARWYAPYANSQYVVVDWWSVGNWGAWGAVFGVRYRFGGER